MEKIGYVITFIWVILISVIIYFRWNDSVNMTLSSWGDFLAGITAPMAFLWLIIGYILQRQELHMNTEALQEQQVELSKQVEELSKQNVLTQAAVESLGNLTDAINNQSDTITQASFQKSF